MNGIESLMVNDFLRQFGHFHTGERAHVILGDMPSSALSFSESSVRHTNFC